ncbi:MAG: hypothetical protein HYR96_13015 [Deltaproteobacteria bacterium]|nr:hypothetical protein [Deltaproteobacteria bacterium]MBI3293955.1 hypothetical protein [Deltaproteobacteria bacterium]
MFLFTATLLGLSLLGGPLWTSLTFREAHVWERLQIGIDNAAIELGQGDRELLRFLDRQNAQIARIEIGHHTVHDCALMAPVAAPCVATDRALEATIAGIIVMTRAQAEARWLVNGLSAEKRLLALDPRFRLERKALVPVELSRCPHCGLKHAVVAKGKDWDARFVGDPRRTMETRVFFQKDRKWNYGLRAE